jgi:hypothetical protein
LLTLANDPNPELDQPFFPPAARFEESSADAGSWFAYAVAEVLAVNESYSAICAAKAEYLGWLAEHQLASSDILRRRIAACLRDSLPRSELLPLITRLGVPTNPFEEAWSDAVFSLMGTS